MFTSDVRLASTCAALSTSSLGLITYNLKTIKEGKYCRKIFYLTHTLSYNKEFVIQSTIN